MTVIDLGGLELDSGLLSKQIKQDLRDDWFKDPLEYQDILDKNNIYEKIVANINTNHGVYSPSKVSVFDIPKKNFTLRYSIEKSIFDRVYYHGLAVYLMRYFDPLLSARSFSHRLQPDLKKQKKHLFKSGVEQWNEFRGAVRAKVRDKYLLETDINSYFENIEVRRLKNCLISMMDRIDADGIEKMKVRRCIDLLFDCLPNWTFDPSTGRGLAQNRDASSFLANILMHDVDQTMLDYDYDYYRYMDDIKIVCDSEHDARRALMRLVCALREKGLGLNSQKTQIYGPDTEVKDLHQDRKIQYIDTLLKSKKKLLAYKALSEIVSYTISLIKENNTQDRAFRYCIRKLEKVSLCDDFAFNKNMLEPVTNAVVDEIGNAPVSTDQFVGYLRAVEISPDNWNKLVSLLIDDQRAIYSWQNYMLWKLFVAKNHFDRKLLAKASLVVRDKSSNDADRAGASLYIGRLGKPIQKRMVAKRFDYCGGFVAQRAALLSVQDLEYKYLKIYLDDKVYPDLVGVLKNLKSGSKYAGCYHVDPEPVTIKNLFSFSGGEDEY